MINNPTCRICDAKSAGTCWRAIMYTPSSVSWDCVLKCCFFSSWKKPSLSSVLAVKYCSLPTRLAGLRRSVRATFGHNCTLHVSKLIKNAAEKIRNGQDWYISGRSYTVAATARPANAAIKMTANRTDEINFNISSSISLWYFSLIWGSKFPYFLHITSCTSLIIAELPHNLQLLYKLSSIS